MASSVPSSPMAPVGKAADATPKERARTCSFCGKIWDRPLSICRCEQVRYCDRECQKKDWPTHKRRCRDKKDVGKEFTKLGVRASFVRKLFAADNVGGFTTDQVVLNFVLRDTALKKPETDEMEKLSMVEVLQRNPETAQHIGPASSYVIHAWRYRWRDLISAIQHSDLDPERFIWLDALCVNQHEGLTDTVPDWWYHGVHDVIETCSHVELVLLPWDRPVPVQRSWCVWEMFGAREKSLDQFKVLVTPDERQRFEQHLRQGKLAFETFQKVFADINIERAETTNAADHAKITKEIKLIGAVKVNDLVMLPVKRWLTDLVDRFYSIQIGEESSPPVSKRWSEAERCNLITARGELYHALGKLDVASKCFEEALEARLRLSNGSEATTDVNTALNNLAAVYMDMAKFDKAQIVLDRAMASCTELYGSSPSPKRINPQVAMTLGNCALNLHHQGKLSQARQLYDEAIKIDEQLKNTDAEIAVRLNNSAKLLQDMGELKSAKKRFEQALPILYEANGEDHPSVATLQNNLALLACAMGNIEEARIKFEQALESLKRTLGSAHPSVAGALNNIAAMYNSQGQAAVAAFYFQEALKIQRAALGNDHPDVATTLNNLASVYSAGGDYEKAFELGREALRIWKSVTGANSPQTRAAKKLWGGEQPKAPPPGSPLLRFVTAGHSPMQARRPSRTGSSGAPIVPGRMIAVSSISSSPAASPASSPAATHRKSSTSSITAPRALSTPPETATKTSTKKKKKKSQKSNQPCGQVAATTSSSLEQVVSMLALGESKPLHSGPADEVVSGLSLQDDGPGEDFDFQRMVRTGDDVEDEDFDFQRMAKVAPMSSSVKKSSPLVNELDIGRSGADQDECTDEDGE